MQWFLDPVTKQYADFTGRASRQTFWMYILFYFLIYIGVMIVGAVTGLEWLALLFSLGVLIPGLAITARRLHDIGKSGWWQLIGFIPLLGLFIMIYLLVQPSEAGANAYGESPVGAGAGAAAPVAPATPVATDVSATPSADTMGTAETPEVK